MKYENGYYYNDKGELLFWDLHSLLFSSEKIKLSEVCFWLDQVSDMLTYSIDYYTDYNNGIYAQPHWFLDIEIKSKNLTYLTREYEDGGDSIHIGNNTSNIYK